MGKRSQHKRETLTTLKYSATIALMHVSLFHSDYTHACRKICPCMHAMHEFVDTLKFIINSVDMT